jgi:hypothetical protein
VNSKASITAMVIAIATAIGGVIIAAGLPLSTNLENHLLTLISVVTPAILGLIGLIHFNHAKVASARLVADAHLAAAQVNANQAPDKMAGP